MRSVPQPKGHPHNSTSDMIYFPGRCAPRIVVSLSFQSLKVPVLSLGTIEYTFRLNEDDVLEEDLVDILNEMVGEEDVN